MRKFKRLARLSFIFMGISSMLFSSVNVSAADTAFYGTNDIIYYDPNACGDTGSASAGAGVVGSYKNPVIDSNAPDPSVIRGEDGKFYLFATGFQQFVSDDMVKWEKINDGIDWIRNNPGWSEDRWAPDIAKIGDTYVLSISGTSGVVRNIGYATSKSAAGPFTYQGELVNSKDKNDFGIGFDIDPNIVQTDEGIFLYYGSGRGYIKAAKLTQNGDRLSAGRSKTVLDSRYGKAPVLAEGAYVYKHGNYYYLYFSSGDWRHQNTLNPYRLHVARSTSPAGPFNEKKEPILKGNSSFTHPGHNSVITDAAGGEFLVYHAYPKGKDYRAVLLDKITYENDWPVINGGNGPSNSPQTGSSSDALLAAGGGGTAPKGTVKVGQANIKVSAPLSVFKTQLDKVVATSPDFISGNEWSSRSNADIERAGYDFYRGTNGGVPSRKTEGIVAMWKSDKWTKVDAGTVVMTREQDITYETSNEVARNSDGKRSIVWVTLKDASGGKVTFMSTHHMVNPNKYAPKPERKALYKLGLERAIVKIKELQNTGPVIIAGDFNAQKSDNGPWHPRQLLGSIGMESTHDTLPPVASYVDWVFYTKRDVKPISHAVPFQLYDHPYLTAKLEFTGNATYSDTASTGQCVCEAKNSSSLVLEGSDNEEKAWNFLTGKGLSPEQTAGIMGNLYAESKFDPNADNNGNYHGIFQWDTNPGGRWERLKTWAEQQGLDPAQFDTQLQYAWKEATDRGNIEGIKQHNDVPHTAWYWGRYFEVAIINGSTSETPLTNVQALAERTEAGERYLAKYGGTTGSPTGGGATEGSPESCPNSGSGTASCSNVNQKPPDEFDIVTFPDSSDKTDKRTLYMVNVANDCLKGLGQPEIKISQGSYCGGGCAGASGSSHDKGGTIDISTNHLTQWSESHDQIEILVKVLREVGFAAWYRDTQDGMAAGNEHIHANALGAPASGPNALGSPGQINAYCDGRAGAYDSSAVDRHLSTIGRPLPEWALTTQPTCTRYPG